LPAGPSNPDCHAGMSFTALRDSAAFPPGRAARRFFVERFGQLSTVAESLRSCGDPRAIAAADLLASLAKRATRGFDLSKPAPAVPVGVAKAATQAVAASTVAKGVETAKGQKLELMFETKRCIHARFCVTGAPNVFLANVQGPWIHPDAMEVERVVEVAHACP